MSDSPEELQRRIAELEAQLRALQAAQAAAPVVDSPAGARDINIATNLTVNNLAPQMRLWASTSQAQIISKNSKPITIPITYCPIRLLSIGNLSQRN
jgi:hypothetical protein